MAKWVIETTEQGFDVKRDSRAFAYDLGTFEEAKRKIIRSSRYSPDDTITLIDQDGYRTRVRV